MIEYAELNTWGKTGMVCLNDAGRDHEAFFPVALLAVCEVDWLTEGGAISLVLQTGQQFRVVFDADDAGQACSDAIELLIGYGAISSSTEEA